MRQDSATVGTATGTIPGAMRMMGSGVRVSSVVKANCGRCVVNLVGPPEELAGIAQNFRFWAGFDVKQVDLEKIGDGVSFCGFDEVTERDEERRAFMIEPSCVGDVEYMAKNGLATMVVPLGYDGYPVRTGAILGRTMILRTDQGIFVVPNSAKLMTVFSVGGSVPRSTQDVVHQAADEFEGMAVKVVEGKTIVEIRFKSDNCVGDGYTVTVFNDGHRTVKTRSTYELKPEEAEARERLRVTSGSYRPVTVRTPRRVTASDIPGALAIGSAPQVHNRL